MGEKDFVSLWKQPEILLICISLCISHCQVCQRSQNMCQMCLVYGYILPGIPQGAIIHENSSIYRFQQRRKLNNLHS